MTQALVVDGAPGLPHGFGVELDSDARPLPSGGWFGGRPARVVRLTDAGAAAWSELRGTAVGTRSAARLARRLTDAGIAHPVPPPLTGRPDVTVVIPVRDRAAQLERCLASLAGSYPVVVVDDASLDELAVRTVAARHGARLIRLATNVGPAQARNVGAAEVHTELIAFVDSDTVPGTEWIAALAAHLADPAVAAVAPRIVPRAAATSAGRYTRARCNLDLGPSPARVVPYGRVSYLPTAALLVRRAAVSEVAGPAGPFDPALSTGEDVDLIWRLDAAGWRIRYDPSHQVPHDEPASWPALLRRRHGYGTSAAPLARRHPTAMAPMSLPPWPLAVCVALASRRPVLALGALAGAARALRRSLRAAGVASTDLPPVTLARGAALAVVGSWIGAGRYLIQFAPWALAGALLNRRARPAALALAVTPALTEWWPRAGAVDPVRFVAGYLADEIAYGAGVLAGCRRERTLVPLRPIVPRRSN